MAGEVYLLDTEFVMPPDWKPEYPGQKCDPRKAQVFQVALFDFKTRQGAQWWFNPGCPIPEENIELSHLTKSDLEAIAAAPRFSDMHREFTDHASECSILISNRLKQARAIVGQNAACDVQALWSSYCGISGNHVALDAPSGWRRALDIMAPVVDALTLFRAALPGLPDYKIGTVAQALGVRVDEATAHTALADCATTVACIELARQKWHATREGRSLPWHRDDELARWIRASPTERNAMRANLTPTLETAYGAALGVVGLDGVMRVGKAKGQHVGSSQDIQRSAQWIAGKWTTEHVDSLDQPFLWRRWVDWLGSQRVTTWK